MVSHGFPLLYFCHFSYVSYFQGEEYKNLKGGKFWCRNKNGGDNNNKKIEFSKSCYKVLWFSIFSL